MKLKTPISLMTLLLALLLIIACGGGEPAEEPAEADPVAETTDSTAEEEEEVMEEEPEESEESMEEEAEPTAEPEEMAEEEPTAEPEEMAEEQMMESACAEDLSGEEIVIYQQAGREGPLATILGQGFAFATEDAVNYVNEHGGVCGAELVVEFCETNYDVEQEIACYERFREADPKPIILLSYGSGATIALKDRVVEDQIVHIVSGLNAEAIYNPVDGYTVAPLPIYSDQFAGFLTWLSENWADVKPESAGDEIVVGVIGWANAFGAGATTPEALAVAEDLGITVLPLEQQEISPEADVTGQVQNLLLQGANVIYTQNLSFGTTQVIGTVRALGVWEDVVMGTVNWGFNTDVISFLGDNPQLADGFYGVYPNRWYDDTDIEEVVLINEAFDAGDYPETERATSYITSFATFLGLRDILEETINTVGYENLTGENVLATMVDMGTISVGNVMTIDMTDSSRSPKSAQIRQMQWDGEQINFAVIEDFFDLPDTHPEP